MLGLGYLHYSIETPEHARFDPAYTSGTMTLTSGNRRVTTNTTTSASTTIATVDGSTTGKSTGKWYWEITIVNKAGQLTVGVVKALTAKIYGIAGGDTFADAFAYYSFIGGWWHDANVIDFNTFTSDGGTTYPNINTGDVIGVALDAGGNQITFYRNGTQMSPTETISTSGGYFAAVGMNTGSTIQANFGNLPFVYSVPTGYNVGLY